ncbi:MAG: hybrid sensor histidine kinase/response regulator [Verrucomicrobia bacterium]|nr:MAG: hybrid sensor histidine kinase/response regulator [Verrucomicrobiota bacterium]
MSETKCQKNRRILVIDDNRAIHDDFRKIFCPPDLTDGDLESFEKALFGEMKQASRRVCFDIDSAYQGQEGLEMARQALASGKPYATAFIDVRMPPGWDGVETVEEIWKVDPDLQVVICSAYSDYSWNDLLAGVGHSDRLVILKKPFDPIEAQQLAQALTEKWRLLQESKNKLNDLEKIVGARTAELQAEIVERKQLEAQFRQAQKMEAFGQLAGGVAHDFNNLLAVIMGFANLLRDTEELGAEAREQIEQVHLAGERAANLTRQLLTFSRKRDMQIRSLNLNDVIGDMAKMLVRLIGEDIKLDCKFSPNLPRVQADPSMMEQVLMNLVVNARDAMPKGGHLMISTDAVVIESSHTRGQSEARAGDFVCLSVRDTGCGMTPEVRARIFEPFFTTKGVGKGTGLGLATVFGIVKQHLGWIEVASEVGLGTSFKIFIPVTSQPAPERQAKVVESKTGEGTETVLLVEDEEAVRGLLKIILQRHGYRVLEAASGSAALLVWKKYGTQIDLLLTDMIMPDGLTGRELAKQLLAQEPGLKVVYSSGYDDDPEGTAFISRGTAVFLQKPYTPKKLIQTVRQCLDG